MAQKVSQATINKIKSMGMTAAKKKAQSGAASAEFNEGVRRMYGKTTTGVSPAMRAERSAGAGAKKTTTPVKKKMTPAAKAERASGATSSKLGRQQRRAV